MLHVKIIFSKLRLVSLLCKGYGVTYWKFQKVRESCLRLISPEQQGFRYGLRLHSQGAWPGFCLDSYRSSCYIMLLWSHRVCYVEMYSVVLLWNNNRFLGSNMFSLRYKTHVYKSFSVIILSPLASQFFVFVRSFLFDIRYSIFWCFAMLHYPFFVVLVCPLNLGKENKNKQTFSSSE